MSGYRVTVVNPTGFPLSGEPDGRGRVTYRPRIGGRRSTVLVSEAKAEHFRHQHDDLVRARQEHALELRTTKKKTTKKKTTKKKTAKKKTTKKKTTKKKTTKTSTAAKPRAKTTTSKRKPPASKTGDKKTYRIAIGKAKKEWPSVEGTAVGQHFGIHKRDDGKLALTHLPSGRSLAVTRTKKHLVEIGETVEAHIPKAAGERSPKKLLAAIHETPFLASWIRALAARQTKLRYAEFRPK